MRKAVIGGLLAFVALTPMLTYPLVVHVADSVEDRQDALLNVWITAWDGHQLLADPLHLFDANIFYPYPRTLAYSELLLGNALLALPVTAISGNPVLGYNLAVLLSFVLSGWGVYLLVWRLTGRPGGGLVAGLVFAFCAYRMSNLAQAQLLTTQWMPFAMLSLLTLCRRPRLRHAVTLVVFFVLQALSSFYYAYMLGFAVLGFLVYEGWRWGIAHLPARSPRGCRQDKPLIQPRSLVFLLLAGLSCALLILPFALPYFRVQRELGFERTLADNEPFSASLRQYAMVPPGSTLHGRWLPSDATPIVGGYPVDALFPGLIPLALAGWGLVRGRGGVRWFFLLLLLGSLVLSLGPRLYLAPGRAAGLDITLPYGWLYDWVPGFKALRAPARFDVLLMFGLAVLAGYGVAALVDSVARCWRRDSTRLALLAACLLLAGLEVVVWPAGQAIEVPVGEDVPALYRWLAGEPVGPVLELPMAFTSGGPQLEYQFLSTYHWHSTPDGYSGFIPPKHGQIVFEMASFPSERSTSLLQALEVKYVIVHTARYSADRWAQMEVALSQYGELVLAERFGSDVVYRVQARDFDPGGLAVHGYLPPRAATAQPYMAYVIALNHDERSFAVQPTDRLRVGVTWERQGNAVGEEVVEADIPLVTSPAGGVALVPFPLALPDVPGTYRLGLRPLNTLLGVWSAEGDIEVGVEGTEAFPVAAQLTGGRVESAVRAGQPLEIGLTWRALGKIDAYYSVYVKLIDGEGEVIAGWDGQPRDGEAPTLLWLPGERIEDRVQLQVPEDVVPGDYAVVVGMYRAEDLARALLIDDDGNLVSEAVLGAVHIELE